MGLDKLGIIFIIIILPISLVLNTYTDKQVDTLNMQLSYDTKLYNSTYDAVKTYKTNSLNEDASNLGDVRIGNINAAVNVFFTSLASNLNMSGYNRQMLQDYVPALVFTMYDGYYIYSKYTNTLGDEDYATNEDIKSTGKTYASTYQNGQSLYGLKPFVHYSCRYKGTNFDFVVSYTLDNYVTIQGIVNNKSVNRSGYLIDTNKCDYDGNYEDGTGTFKKYRNVEINEETILTDNLILETEDGSKPNTIAYPYHKVNGVKYYWDGTYWFSMLNGTKNRSYYNFDIYGDTKYDNFAYTYYKEAYEFSNWVQNDIIDNINDNGADNDVEASYTTITEDGSNNTKKITGKIKDIFNLTDIEYPTSNFNQHRQEVIRYTIEKNLSIAIANYNTYSNFRMPEFKEEEWDRIQKNMTVISYLQGLPIGTKIYNGVSVVSNNVNEEVVSEDSIYIANGPNTTAQDAAGYNYYPVTQKDLSVFDDHDPVGVYNVDLQRRQVEYNKQSYYYYPKLYFSSYSPDRSTVNLNAESKNVAEGNYNYGGNLYKYLDDLVRKRYRFQWI